MREYCKNKTGKSLKCAICDFEIENEDMFWFEGKEILCECCYEDKHEYDGDH